MNLNVVIMNQKDKNLLLIDICARVPWGVKVYINSCIDEQNQMGLFDVNFASETIGVCNEKWVFRAIPIVDVDDNTKIIKPYLRPMSSMTEEEKEELKRIALVDNEGVPGDISVYIDWLNAHHFDYRGLIEKGLALEAPKDMYN